MTTEELKKVIMDNKEYLANNDFLGFQKDILSKTMPATDAEKIIEFLGDCGIFDDAEKAFGDSIPKMFGYIPKSWKSSGSNGTLVTVPPVIKKLDRLCFYGVKDVDEIDIRNVEEIDMLVFDASDFTTVIVSGKLTEVNARAFESSQVKKVILDTSYAGKMSYKSIGQLRDARKEKRIELEIK